MTVDPSCHQSTHPITSRSVYGQLRVDVIGRSIDVTEIKYSPFGVVFF